MVNEVSKGIASTVLWCFLLSPSYGNVYNIFLAISRNRMQLFVYVGIIRDIFQGRQNLYFLQNVRSCTFIVLSIKFKKVALSIFPICRCREQFVITGSAIVRSFGSSHFRFKMGFILFEDNLEKRISM